MGVELTPLTRLDSSSCFLASYLPGFSPASVPWPLASASPPLYHQA